MIPQCRADTNAQFDPYYSTLTISMKLFLKVNISPSSEHMDFLNSSSRLAAVVWKESFVTPSVRFGNSKDSKNFTKTSFFCSSFSHLSKASIFSHYNASYAIISVLTPLLFCFPLNILSTELIPMRAASMQRSSCPNNNNEDRRRFKLIKFLVVYLLILSVWDGQELNQPLCY